MRWDLCRKASARFNSFCNESGVAATPARLVAEQGTQLFVMSNKKHAEFKWSFGIQNQNATGIQNKNLVWNSKTKNGTGWGFHLRQKSVTVDGAKMPLYLWPNITLMVLVTSHNLSRHDIRLTIAMRSSGAGMRTRDVERKIRTIVLWMRSQCNVIRYR